VRLDAVTAQPLRNRDFADAVAFALENDSQAVVVLASDSRHGAVIGAELACKTSAAVHVLDGGFQSWVAAGLPVSGNAAAALAPESLQAEEAEAAIAEASVPRLFAPFRPKLLSVLAEGYSLSDLKTDVLSGLSVGIIALSLSMALGIASESTPAAGLYTAVSAGFVVSAFGGSRIAIGGPTAAFIPIVIGVAREYGPEGLTTCTVLAGGMLIAMGSLGLGNVIAKIPRPVVTGFTAGIATFIFSTQLKDFLGLENIGRVPAQFAEKLAFLSQHLDATNGPSLALATVSLLFLRFYPAAWARVVPPQIIVVGASMLLVHVLDISGISTGIETIGSRVGADAIPSSLPIPHLAMPDLATTQHLAAPAFTIATLAAIESLLCAVVADDLLAKERGVADKHDSNTELMAQGLANILSASVGGLPATGALARTAANVRCGGRSPISGMVHALTVLGVLVWEAPLAAYVPLPALSAVLVVVALNMGEWKNLQKLPTQLPGDALVYIASFMLTVLTDVTVAVEAGLLLSLLFYLKRVTDAAECAHPPPQVSGGASSGVETLELSGALLFGATGQLEAASKRTAAAGNVSVLVLDCSRLIAVDSTGIEALEGVEKRLHAAGKQLVLSGLRLQPHSALDTGGFVQKLGRANVVRTEEAQQRARLLLAAQDGTRTNPPS